MDNNLPKISIDDVFVIEGDGAMATFTVSLSKPPAEGKSVSVKYTTQPRTALGGIRLNDRDYTDQTKQIRLTAAEPSQTFTVPIINDRLDEDPETFSVMLSNAAGATIADGEGICTILPDNDPAPKISIELLKDARADSNFNLAAEFKVQLSAPSGKVVKVDYATLDGTGNDKAIAGTDYQGINDTITFNPTTLNGNRIIPAETSAFIRVEPISREDITHATLEIFAKDVAYQDWAVGESLNKLPYGDLGYSVSQVFQGADGFYAVGLTSDEKFFLTFKNPINGTLDAEQTQVEAIISHDNREPVLAIRGTDDIKDFYSDAQFDGVGQNQFRNNNEQIQLWLKEQEDPEQWVRWDTKPSITGHSLGGALSQLVAGDFLANDGDLGQVVTFNSPGLTFYPESWDDLRNTNATHYITSGDLVSLAGRRFLPGEYVLSNYISSPLDILLFKKHSAPILANSISRNGLFKPGNLAQLSPMSTDILNSFFFGYSYNSGIFDVDFFAFRVGISKIPYLGPAVAAAITFRGTAESARQAIGLAGVATVNAALAAIDAVQAAWEAAKQYGAAAVGIINNLSNKAVGFWDSVSQWSKAAWDASTQWAETSFGGVGIPHAWISMITWTDVGWKTVATWNDAVWNATTRWSAAAWSDTATWSDSVWAATTKLAAQDWQLPFFTFSSVFPAGAPSINYGPTFAENNPDSRLMTFEVGLSFASSSPVTVDFTTVDGSAKAGLDYTATQEKLTFAPGQTKQLVTVAVLDDQLAEGDETFSLELRNPSQSLLLKNAVVATIVDNEIPAAGLLQFRRSDYSVLEDGRASEKITVTRTRGSVGEVSATIAFVKPRGIDDPATSADYVDTPIQIWFADGDTAPKEVVVPIIDDTIPERSEKVVLELTNLTNGAVTGSNKLAELSILDNDSDPIVGNLEDALIRAQENPVSEFAGPEQFFFAGESGFESYPLVSTAPRFGSEGNASFDAAEFGALTGANRDTAALALEIFAGVSIVNF